MSGNIDTRTEQIPATGIVNLGNANFLFVISSSASVSFKMKRLGLGRGANQENYSGLVSGLQVARTQRWDQCDITGAAGTTVTFMYGYTDVREDVTLFNQQIAVISGVTAVRPQPFSTVADSPVVPCPNAAQTNIFPQNLLRAQISFSLPANAVVPAATVFARKAGGGNNLYEIQPGIIYTEVATYGLDIRNDSGGALNFMIDEVA